jgi:hypothetical protein
MEKRGVYVFYNQCIHDSLPPHNLLFKIGGGDIAQRFVDAQKTQGTYIPYGYEILAAKIIGEDWQVYEKKLHDKFARHRILPQLGSGLGKEWFRNLTPEMILHELDNIPGEYYAPPVNGNSKAEIQRKCIDVGVPDSFEYSQMKQPDWLEKPWGENPVDAFAFFNPTATRMSKEDFCQLVFEENGVRTRSDYEELLNSSKGLPTLRQIADGYFGIPVTFLDLKEEYMPSRRRG